MNKQRYQYKDEAKEILRGNYEKPVIVLLAFYIINAVIGSLLAKTSVKYTTTLPLEVVDPGNPALNTILSIVEFLVGAAIVYATIKLALFILHRIDFNVEDIIFSGFKENFLRNAFLQFMRTLFTVLWMFLFIIPGFVKAYAYSMSFYLVNKESDLYAMAAIEKSKNYTRGYKWDLFMLDLSYLGWYFIGLFTFGILWLWIIPKHQVARAMYFEEIYENFTPTKKDEISELY